jgi:hypothetical protein
MGEDTMTKKEVLSIVSENNIELIRFVYIDNEEWKPLEEDIFKMLNQPIIGKRWKKNKHGYPAKFQLFIDSNLKKLHNQADALGREKAVPK